MSTARRALVFVFCVLTQLGGQAGILEDLHQTLSVNDERDRFSLQLSGLVDVEAYGIDRPATGLLFTDHALLFNPRLTFFLDAQLGSDLYVFAQARTDRGFDPADSGAELRLDEYFLRYTAGTSSKINFQIGQFATAVGNWVSRHDSWQNPFINAPLPYEHLTGIWDVAAPGSIDTLLGWGHVGKYDNHDYSDKYLRLPIIWGPSYATGASVFGSVGRFDYAAEVKNTALASRPETWSITQTGFDSPTFSGRVAVRPDQIWNIGFSASGGPYLLPRAAATLPADRDVGDYRELVLAQDVSFAWHHLQLWAEFYEARFEVPLLGNADTFAYYLEAKYKIAPQLFGAVRWNQQLFSTMRDEETRVQWGDNVGRIDAALGYRFTNHLQGKLQYSISHREASPDNAEHLVGAQLTLKF